MGNHAILQIPDETINFCSLNNSSREFASTVQELLRYNDTPLTAEMRYSYYCGSDSL